MSPASPKPGPAQVHAAAGKPAETKPADPKAAETKPADPKPAETKPAETKPAGLDLAFIETGAVALVPEVLVKQAAPHNKRNEKQQKMDANVKRLHDVYVAAGKPSQWGKLVESRCVATYFVDPSQAAELKRLVNAGAQLHRLRARFGTSFVATEDLVKKYGLPQEYIGREVISFAIMDKVQRTTK